MMYIKYKGRMQRFENHSLFPKELSASRDEYQGLSFMKKVLPICKLIIAHKL